MTHGDLKNSSVYQGGVFINRVNDVDFQSNICVDGCLASELIWDVERLSYSDCGTPTVAKATHSFDINDEQTNSKNNLIICVGKF